MRFRPMPGVSVASVKSDGCLELVADTARGRARYRCGPTATAMWIALRVHDGNPDAAAHILAGLWRTDPVNARTDLEIWVEEMSDAGLMRAEP